MNPQETIKLLEDYLQATMAAGVIKNFATLDKLREAIQRLRDQFDPA